jgi:hypothetical protein
MRILVLLMGLALFPLSAWAAAPYRVDDAKPTEHGAWEVDVFSSGTFVRGGAGAGVLPGLEVDYGAFEGVQIHLSMPLGFSKVPGRGTGFGYGDTELGLKIRLVNPSAEAWWPAIAFEPLVEVPTGNQRLGLSTGHAQVFLPVWMSRNFGEHLSVAAGGGHWTNPGVGNKDWWFAGTSVQYEVTEGLSIGTEVFYQTASVTGGRDSVGFNVGAVIKLSEVINLTASAGRGLRNAERTNAFSYYTGVQFNF